MAVTIKTPEEIQKMRVAGRLAAEVLEVVAPHVQAGVTTAELDRVCHDHIVRVQGAVPAPLNYHGFPKSICTSVNQQVCHGPPQWGTGAWKHSSGGTARRCSRVSNMR